MVCGLVERWTKKDVTRQCKIRTATISCNLDNIRVMEDHSAPRLSGLLRRRIALLRQKHRSRCHRHHTRTSRRQLVPQALRSLSQADRFFSDELKHKLIKGSYAAGILGSTAVYGLMENWKCSSKQSTFLSLLSTSSRVTSMLAYDVPQTIRSEGTCK